MSAPRNLKTIAGCPTRILVSITAPEDTDTELTGYVNTAGNPIAAAVQGSAQEGEVLFPPLPAGEHLYEIRIAGKPIAWGHLLARQTPYPLQPTDVVDWELTADLTATDAAQISLELLPGARGLTGESAYDAAVQGGYEGTEEEFAAMLAGLPQDAANAAESAQDAAASQAAAAASQAAAAASATAAGNSATAAANSATAASTKATEAANSAATAATKATDAATSATAAAGSATEAGISAASAGASAQDAADDAADAATAAATATAQATEATTQAGNAAASATTASQQATAAANSASAAAGSATTAGTKATEAAGSATTASTKATEAANSASAAAQSAEDAAEAAELLDDAALQGRNNAFTQTNTFNGAAAFNGPTLLNGNISGNSVVTYPSGRQKIIDAQLAGELIFNEFFNYTWADSYAHYLSEFMPGYMDRTFVDVYWDANTVKDGGRLTNRFMGCPNLMRLRVFTNSTVVHGYAMSGVTNCPELREVLYFAPYALTVNSGRTFFNYGANPKLTYLGAYFHSATVVGNFAMGGANGKHVTVYAPKATKALAFSEGTHTALITLKLTTGKVTDCTNMLRYWAGLTTLVWEGFNADGTSLDNPVKYVSNGASTFSGCKALPANQFPAAWPALADGSGMFLDCSLLDETKANAILDSLPDWSSEETPTNHIITFTGTAAATTWLADGADLSHVQAAEAKGWTVDYGQNA